MFYCSIHAGCKLAGLACCIALLYASSVAQAEHAETQDTVHGGQAGLRVGLATPYKVVFRRDDSPPCMPNDDQVCAFFGTPALDLALSCGLLDAVEPYVWLRLGLSDETQTRTAAAQVFGFGARVYTTQKAFKLFLEGAVGFSMEGSLDPALTDALNYETDLLIHANFGGQYDFSRNVGVFVALGPSAGTTRALSLHFEAVFGVQGRAF